MFNKTDGEVVHIDFGYVALKGLSLGVPEIVEFRLTFNLRKNFCAWERACVLDLDFIIFCTFRHSFPYFNIPSMNFSCSSFDQRPVLYSFELFESLISFSFKINFTTFYQIIPWEYIITTI